MTTLDLPWYGNNNVRYQAEILNFLVQNSDAVANEWAEIVLHIGGVYRGTARSEHHLPVSVKGDAVQTAVRELVYGLREFLLPGSEKISQTVTAASPGPGFAGS